MTTMYKLQKDVAGYNGFGLQFSDQKVSATLAVTTDTSTTVPSNGAIGAPLNQINRFLAVIQASDGKEVWCANNAVAGIPAGASFASTVSELIIGGEYYAREVKAGDVLHFFAPAAATDVSIMYYALQAS